MFLPKCLLTHKHPADAASTKQNNSIRGDKLFPSQHVVVAVPT